MGHEVQFLTSFKEMLYNSDGGFMQNFFKKILGSAILKIFIGLALIVSGLTFFFINFPSNVISTSLDGTLFWVFSSASWFRGSFRDLIDEIKISREAKEEIAALKREISFLRDQMVDYNETKHENARLIKYCDIKKTNPKLKFVSADCIGAVPFTAFGELIINVGGADGISIGDTVITENGFVGRISRVGDFTSTVCTIFSPRAGISAIDSVTGNSGVISGDPKFTERGFTRLTLIPSKDSVYEGDIVTTSGMSGIYPKSIKIGTIESVEYDKSAACYIALVRPFEKVSEIKDVLIWSIKSAQKND
jgi:rod shape-determining protein MreC